MNDLYENRNSIYCYENTNVLVNKLDIREQEKLDEVERRISLGKLYRIAESETLGNFDIQHIVEIHKFLFEDIYEFAGKLRTENIAKGSTTFAYWNYIESELTNLLDKLKKENYLMDIKDKKEFSKRLAYYMAELNVIHPFREGNGRTIREFIRQLALKSGYYLSYKDIDPKELLEASIKSVLDTSDLEELLYKGL